MGACLCKKDTVDNTESQLQKVISASYIPPSENSESKNEKQTDIETQSKEITHKPTTLKFKIDTISVDNNDDNNHIKLDKNGVYLNHFSPLPSSNKHLLKIKTDKSRSDFHIKLHRKNNSNSIHLDHYSPLISSNNETFNTVNLLSKENTLKETSNAYHNEEKVNIYSKQIDFASGAFAHVFICNIQNNKKVAIKKLDVDNSENITKWSMKTPLKEAETELYLLKHLNGNINIINLIDNFYETTVYNDLYLYLVMDFIETSLDKEIIKYGKEGKNIPIELIKIYSFQILNGLKYMKMKNVIHRDIKPENLLIDPFTNIIKICDFGCSKLVENDSDINMENYVCSRYYRAPELLLEASKYSYSVDMWSFGCILCEMYLGQIMFDGNNTKNQVNEIIKILGIPNRYDLREMNDKYEYNKLLNKFECQCDNARNWRFVFVGIDDVSQYVIDLIDKILIYVPNDRLIPIDAMKHEYFNRLCEDEKVVKQYNVAKELLKLINE
eukprot:338003_1